LEKIAMDCYNAVRNAPRAGHQPTENGALDRDARGRQVRSSSGTIPAARGNRNGSSRELPASMVATGIPVRMGNKVNRQARMVAPAETSAPADAYRAQGCRRCCAARLARRGDA